MTLDERRSPQAVFKYDAAVRLLRRLRDAGHAALFAGGCVRDLLMHRRPKDYDIATDATPDQVTKLFEKVIPVGAEFGVVKVVVAGIEFEVATFRSDMEYSDGRRPRGVEFTGPRQDALRRDFTVNGMFFDPISGEVIDYVGGRRDIQARLIRAIGPPRGRFAEDYLRMLRAVRFAAVLGFEIERETFEAIRENVEKIKDISGERIREELEAMLCDRSRRSALELLDASGLLEAVLPELAATKGVRQGRVLHPEGDVWQHTLLAMENLEDPSFTLAMGVLLHDVGKPPSAAGARPFLNHERIGERMARNIAGRLKLSKRETETIAFLVRYHMILKDARHMRKSTLKRVIGHELFDDLAEVHRIDAVASNGDLSNYEFAMKAARELSKQEVKPEPLVNGHDLQAIGIEPGPRMGIILKRLYTAQLDEKISTREQALAMARRLKAGGSAKE